MFLENGYATMKKHRSVSNRKIPRVHKRKMEEIHDKCDKGGAGSVIKKAALKKPLDKITINDLTTDCGISRMAFYYILRISMILSNGRAGGCDAGAAGKENV